MLDNKFIGVWTIGMMSFSSEVREAVGRKFLREVRLSDDWFYSVEVDGMKFFVCENGELDEPAAIVGHYRDGYDVVVRHGQEPENPIVYNMALKPAKQTASRKTCYFPICCHGFAASMQDRKSTRL